MGLLLRAAVVIGAIYALSPVSAPPTNDVSAKARAILADPAKAVAVRALDACLAAPDVCARLASGITATGSTSSTPHPPARPTPSGPR